MSSSDPRTQLVNLLNSTPSTERESSLCTIAAVVCGVLHLQHEKIREAPSTTWVLFTEALKKSKFFGLSAEEAEFIQERVENASSSLTKMLESVLSFKRTRKLYVRVTNVFESVSIQCRVMSVLERQTRAVCTPTHSFETMSNKDDADSDSGLLYLRKLVCGIVLSALCVRLILARTNKRLPDMIALKDVCEIDVEHSLILSNLFQTASAAQLLEALSTPLLRSLQRITILPLYLAEAHEWLVDVGSVQMLKSEIETTDGAQRVSSLQSFLSL